MPISAPASSRATPAAAMGAVPKPLPAGTKTAGAGREAGGMSSVLGHAGAAVDGRGPAAAALGTPPGAPRWDGRVAAGTLAWCAGALVVAVEGTFGPPPLGGGV